MSQNVNVINNAGKDVVVTVNKENGNTQIVIELAGNRVELSTLKASEVFKANNVEYIVLEQHGRNGERDLNIKLIKERYEVG